MLEGGGGALRDRGSTGKVRNHGLMDFIIFKFLLTSYLDIVAKITKTCKKNFRLAGVIMSTSGRLYRRVICIYRGTMGEEHVS